MKISTSVLKVIAVAVALTTLETACTKEPNDTVKKDAPAAGETKNNTNTDPYACPACGMG